MMNPIPNIVGFMDFCTADPTPANPCCWNANLINPASPGTVDSTLLKTAVSVAIGKCLAANGNSGGRWGLIFKNPEGTRYPGHLGLDWANGDPFMDFHGNCFDYLPMMIQEVRATGGFAGITIRNDWLVESIAGIYFHQTPNLGDITPLKTKRQMMSVVFPSIAAELAAGTIVYIDSAGTELGGNGFDAYYSDPTLANDLPIVEFGGPQLVGQGGTQAASLVDPTDTTSWSVFTKRTAPLYACMMWEGTTAQQLEMAKACQEGIAFRMIQC